MLKSFNVTSLLATVFANTGATLFSRLSTTRRASFGGAWLQSSFGAAWLQSSFGAAWLQSSFGAAWLQFFRYGLIGAFERG